MKILFGLAFVLCFSVSYALKCYQYFSVKSWDDCQDSIIPGICPDGWDRCSKEDIKGEIISGEPNSELFAKGCVKSSDCSAKNCTQNNRSVNITKCELDCCKGDLCNGAEAPMLSAIMLLSSAIVAFAR